MRLAHASRRGTANLAGVVAWRVRRVVDAGRRALRLAVDDGGAHYRRRIADLAAACIGPRPTSAPSSTASAHAGASRRAATPSQPQGSEAPPISDRNDVGLVCSAHQLAQLTNEALRRGAFHSVPDLIDAIEDYLKTHDDNPKPFVWTATADQIMAKVRRTSRPRTSGQSINATYPQ